MRKKTRSFITHLGTAVPLNELTQEDAVQFLQKTVARAPKDQRMVEVLYRLTQIQKRYSVLKDYTGDPGGDLFPSNQDLTPTPGTAARMEFYQKFAAPLGAEAVRNGIPPSQLKEVTHLITVSCTGMYAPGLDLDLLENLALPGSTQRTCINFMGCYAAFNALKTADLTVRANPEAKVLIVAVELCTLHFQTGLSRDEVLANSLFGDGAAAVLVEGQARSGWNLRMDKFLCELVPEGDADMTWAIGDQGFEMHLSSYVPKLLSGVANQTLEKLLDSFPVKRTDIQEYAIHPGGKRILEGMEKALEIPRSANEYGYQVLSEFGNMSSATFLFVLKRMMENRKAEDDKNWLLGMAFGPGLTLESGLFQWEWKNA